MGALTSAASTAIRLYQRYVSADYNGGRHACCLYAPSCSHYMADAIKKEGPVRGTLDGVLRLSRCNQEGAGFYLQEFGRDVLACPPDQIADRFTYESAGARTRVREMKDLIVQNQQLAAAGQQGEAAAVQARWTGILRDDIRIKVVDQPGADRTVHPHFVVCEKPLESPVAPVKRGILRSAVRATAGVLAGVGGALLGAAVFGLGETAAAVLLAPVAGRGKMEALNEKIAREHGAATVVGLRGFERKLGGAAARIHQFVEKHARSAVAASILGVGIGLPVGVIVGLFDGLRAGASPGWQGGSIFGRNLADAALR